MARVPMTTETAIPFKCVINAENVGLTPEQFFRLCSDNPDFRLELTAQKEIVIMPPSGLESDWKSGEVFGQLREWAKRDGTGRAFGPSAGYTLPNGAIRSPDASWLRNEKWNALTAAERRKFARVCPDFVIEVRSPSDALSDQQEKMVEYIENGAKLGFLIDSLKGRLYIHRPKQRTRCLKKTDSVTGDPELPGFTLDLTEIW